MSEKTVAAIILNWNNYEDTKNCINYLSDIKYEKLDVIVVDNGSDDKSVQKLGNCFNDVEILENKENRGFSGGMNRGIKHTYKSYDYIWILNNDIIIDDGGILGDLIKKIESSQKIAAVSPIIKRYPNTSQDWFIQGKIKWDGTASHVDNPERDSDLGYFNEYIPLCCTLIRSTVFEEGFLPEDYFLYYEDLAFSTMLRKNGYILITDPTTTIYHKVGASTNNGGFSLAHSYYRSRNHIKYSKCYIDGKLWALSYLYWMVKAVTDRLISHNPTASKAIIEGAIDGIRQRYGRGPYP